MDKKIIRSYLGLFFAIIFVLISIILKFYEVENNLSSKILLSYSVIFYIILKFTNLKYKLIKNKFYEKYYNYYKNYIFLASLLDIGIICASINYLKNDSLFFIHCIFAIIGLFLPRFIEKNWN